MLDFLGIGAEKAGSTWLWRWLRTHPEIWLPKRKELHFWDEYFQPGAKQRNDLRWYAQQFDNPNYVSGEVTPSYALLDPSEIDGINTLFPGFKALYVLRNPVDRALSSARMQIQRNRRRYRRISPSRLLTLVTEASCVANSNYPVVIKNWRAVIGASRLKVMLFDDLVEAPADFLQECVAFLSCSSGPFSALGNGDTALRQRVHLTRKIPIPSDLYRAQLQFYEPQIRETEALIGRSLDRWMAAVADPTESTEFPRSESRPPGPESPRL